MDENIVRSAPLFAALDDDGKQAVLDSMTQEDYHRGSVVFREGDQGDRLFIIGNGKVKVGHASGDGRENLLAVLGPGETLGELSLFDPAPRNATATAVAETTLYSLTQQDLYRVLAQRPEVARHLLASLARRLRKTNESLADLVFADVPGRVAKNLLDLAQRFGRQTDDGVMVSHGLTQEELAQLVGASRETVNKALADFASRGWIRLEARAVLLIDIERLRRRAR
ncbi:MAG: Crp/Fnr family transcriptional regulator [Dermabacter sp.]|nr:Crp/Fnr family transcriptional regulator [Dermabacter sp.]